MGKEDQLKHAQTQNRFKKMMDNSCEGILIMEDKIIGYLNDKFIN